MICQSDRVCVVAGGWSVTGEGFHLEQLPGAIIAANDAAMHIPHVDYIVSMDRLWMQNRWNALRERKTPTYLRDAAARLPPNEIASAQAAGWLRLFSCDYLSADHDERPDVINGPSSGICAINLAFKLRPRQVFLLGFDGRLGPNGEAYFYDKYEWNPKGPKEGRLREWALSFSVIARTARALRCEVFNCSLRSTIGQFPRLDAEALVAVAATCI